MKNYVKHNYFDKEQAVRQIKNTSLKQGRCFTMNKKDFYYCSIGQQMKNIGTVQSKTKTGFIQNISRYQATNCKGRPLRVSCHKSKGNRVIEINHPLRKYKQQVKQNLQSEKGIYRRKKRRQM